MGETWERRWGEAGVSRSEGDVVAAGIIGGAGKGGDWSRLVPLIDFWEMLMRHIDGVVAWAKHRLSNAALEGNNSRVRGLSQRARGYRNHRNLMLVLYHASWW